MKLLFDLAATQPNISGKRHGGGRYGEIILLHMVERGEKFGVFYDSSRWLNPEMRKACERGGVAMHDVYGSSVERIINDNGYTRLYSCLPGALAELTCCEVYGTMHGLRELETPFDNIFYSYYHPIKEVLKFSIKSWMYSQFVKYKKRILLRRYIQSSF